MSYRNINITKLKQSNASSNIGIFLANTNCVLSESQPVALRKQDHVN